MGFGKDGRGIILYDQVAIPLGSASPDSIVATSGRFTGNLEEDFRITRLDLWAGFQEPLPADEGPILIGIGSGTLDATELAECLDSSPFDNDGVPDIEETMRPVWPLAILTGSVTAPPTISMEKVLRWTFKNPAGWNWWARSLDDDSLAGGSIIVVFAKIFGVWVN